MKIYKADELPQHLENGTANPDWLAVRAGKFTGSDFYLYMSLLKKNELSDTAESKLYEKCLEQFGYGFDNMSSVAMERGTELEPIARAEYIAETFNDVQEVGFVDLESNRAGCSPDGVILKPKLKRVTPRYFSCGDVVAVDDEDVVFDIEKIIEIKCPGIKNYIKMAKGKIPTQYMVQMQFNMFVTGAKSCDFIVYHPDMKLHIQEVLPDEQMQKDIRTVLEKLNAMYDEIIKDIDALHK